MQPPEDKLLRPRAVAEMFGVSTATLIRWARDGKLTPVVTPGGHHRYSETTVRALLGQDTRERTDERQLAEDAVRLYGQGWTIQQVADRLDSSYGTMRRLLQEHTTLRRPGSRSSTRE